MIEFFIKFFGLFISEILEGFVRIFVPKKPKVIRGKLALVTGGGQGLGAAICHRLASEGCNIAICDINLSTSEAVCTELIKEYAVKAEAFKCDVRDNLQIPKLRNEIEEKFGCHVDILCLNAGVLAPLAVLEGEDEDIKRVIDINLVANFWFVRTFLPKMIEQKFGHILGIASAASKACAPFSCYYNTSKYGVNGFYKSVYEDLCIYDYDEFVKVTVAMPGFIDTRKDLIDLLKNMNDVMQRTTPSQAADIIVKAMLLDKREIFFPLQYKFGALLDIILPRKTSKLLKKTVAGMNVHNEEYRKTMAKK